MHSETGYLFWEKIVPYIHVQYTGTQQMHLYLYAVIYNFQQTQKKNKQ
jgi:hypothetical protein